MDYSLLVGIHDCDLAAANGAGDQRNYSFDNDIDEADIEDEQDDEDSPGSGGVGGGGAATGDLTPPDSPVVLYQVPFFTGELDKSLEFFAVKCSDSMCSLSSVAHRQGFRASWKVLNSHGFFCQISGPWNYHFGS